MNEKRVWFVLMASVAACSASGASEPTSSSVSPSKPLDTLSEADVDALCSWLNEQGGSYVPTKTALCTQLALQGQGSPEACEAEVAACLRQHPGDLEVSCSLTPEALATCSATAGQFESCARDRATRDERYFEELSCSDPSSSTPYAQPESCEILLSLCPSLAADPSDRPTDGTGGDGSEPDAYVDGAFVCDDGRDLEDDFRCDGLVDCFAGEDESGCERPNLFTCGDGNRVDASLVCDQRDDCLDKGDELNCDDGYLCLDGVDIWDARLCDGSPDCARGEDEASCPSTTDPDPIP